MKQQNNIKSHKIGFIILLYYVTSIASNETLSTSFDDIITSTETINDSTAQQGADVTPTLDYGAKTLATTICTKYNNNNLSISSNKYINDDDDDDSKNNYTIDILDGDIVVTIITKDDIAAAPFIVDRINGLGLIYDNITIGIRIIKIKNETNVRETLLDEVEYLQECVDHSLGIFIAQELWAHLDTLSKNLGYTIWKLPSPNDLLYSKVAHLLYELPWNNQNSSIEIKSQTSEIYNKFLSISKREHLCLESFPSDDALFIILGISPVTNFISNGTIIVVLSGSDKLFISDLPDKSFIITENEIDISHLYDHNLTQLYDIRKNSNKLLATDLISLGSVFLELVEFLNHSIDLNCGNKEEAETLLSCSNIFQDIGSWQYEAKLSSHQIISNLKLDNYTGAMNFELLQKFRMPVNESDDVMELRPIASSNIITNVTTVYHFKEGNDDKFKNRPASKLGNIFYCSKEYEIKHPDFSDYHRPILYGSDFMEMYWQIKQEAWVAAGLTVSSLGILLCLAILTFLVIRVCMDDVMEGNPTCSILLLVSLIFQFASFIPFSVEYTGYHSELLHRADTLHTWNLMCSVKLFLVSVCYCTTFSLLLCRAIMLASIGSEGGFLSHVNGYLQSIICMFSTLVQVGLSTQLMLVLHANSRIISCNEIYYGNLFWGIIAYDGVLLTMLVFLSPFIFKSQRNYREGILLVTGAILCLIIWTIWIPLCMLGFEWREAAVPLGVQATALAVLVGVMIPRCFLMVRSIARSDLVQALPSLTSLAFAQANQYISEQSIYECVNPAMRHQRSPTDETFIENDVDEPYPSPSEIPTLPLRGTRRQQNNINNNYSYTNSIHSDFTASPSKITRF